MASAILVEAAVELRVEEPSFSQYPRYTLDVEADHMRWNS